MASLAETIPPATRAATRLGAESQDRFVARYGSLFEHSPWIARDAWRAEGFADSTSMIDAMMQVVLGSGEAERMTLLRAHPELAGDEAQRGTLTSASGAEQAGAGLDRLAADERSEFKRLNRAYRERHGFPFIVCARHYTKLGILAELERRTKRPTGAEMEEALAQVAFIARLRLEQILSRPGTAA